MCLHTFRLGQCFLILKCGGKEIWICDAHSFPKSLGSSYNKCVQNWTDSCFLLWGVFLIANEWETVGVCTSTHIYPQLRYTPTRTFLYSITDVWDSTWVFTDYRVTYRWLFCQCNHILCQGDLLPTFSHPNQPQPHINSVSVVRNDTIISKLHTPHCTFSLPGQTNLSLSLVWSLGKTTSWRNRSDGWVDCSLLSFTAPGFLQLLSVGLFLIKPSAQYLHSLLLKRIWDFGTQTGRKAYSMR